MQQQMQMQMQMGEYGAEEGDEYGLEEGQYYGHPGMQQDMIPDNYYDEQDDDEAQ